MITQKYLKSILHYCPNTGVFTWIKTHSTSNKKAGDNAGHTHKKTGYVSITINGKFNAAHRLAWLYMTGKYPEFCIDHINQIKSDNRFENLRDVENCVNMRNKRLRKNSLSGISGVFIDNASGKWEVKITCKGVKYYFGRYNDIQDAIKVRNHEIKSLGFTSIHGRY